MLDTITVIVLTGPSRRLAQKIVSLGHNIFLANCIEISEQLRKVVRLPFLEWDEGECLNWNSYIGQIWINYLLVLLGK